MARRRAAWLMTIALGVLATASARAAERCAMSCRAEVAVCRRAECANTVGAARRACVEGCRGRAGCPTRLRTVAYVVTRCRSHGDRLVASQELRIRRGDCDPVTVMRFESPGEVADPGGLCRLLADNRQGFGSVLAGAFQRIGVAPDGSGVVFEVTNQFMLVFPATPIPEDLQGFFYVRADGTGLRRVGPPSRDPTYRVGTTPGGSLSASFHYYLPFDPRGERVVYTDIGVAPDGNAAPQVFTLDLATGRRTQVTNLPRAVPNSSLARLVQGVSFVDQNTIGFSTELPTDLNDPGGTAPNYFLVRTDGSGLRPFPTLAPLPESVVGSPVTPVFGVASQSGRGIAAFRLAVRPVNPDPDYPNDLVLEVFRFDGKKVLQLTAFGRYDTFPLGPLPYAAATRDQKRRVFFMASANPLGQNPLGNCQLFSADGFGGRVRQLTRFDEGKRSVLGCNFHTTAGCSFKDVYRDPARRSILFYSDCNPLGTNPNGSELFLMRDDGSELRQLTRSAGVRTLPGGDVDVEITAQFSYALPLSLRPFRTRTLR
jgi:hypothetical protein